MLDPNENHRLHREGCGFWGPCDCDAHELSFLEKILRLIGLR